MPIMSSDPPAKKKAKSSSTVPAKRPAGLPNKDEVDCFINSFVQVLAVCPGLGDHFLGKKDKPWTGDAIHNLAVETGKVIYKLYTRAESEDDEDFRCFPPETFQTFLDTVSMVQNLTEFTSNLASADEANDERHDQHDVANFIEQFLTYGLSDEVVGGKKKVTLKCQACKTERTSEDGTMFRILHAHFKEGGSGRSTLIKRLEHSCERSVTEGVVCPHCSKVAGHEVHQDHEVLEKLRELPRVLIVQLVRHDFEALEERKNDSEVVCPLHLDLESIFDDPNRESESETTYRLFGVINHEGADCSSGHNTADICFLDKWYDCNDEIVTQYEGGFAVKKKEVYVLAYRRNDVEALTSF